MCCRATLADIFFTCLLVRSDELQRRTLYLTFVNYVDLVMLVKKAKSYVVTPNSLKDVIKRSA